MTVEELRAWRVSGRDFVLLDVREPYELEQASLPGALHIPMREIPARSAELDRHAEIAVLCQHGVRSEHVAVFLRMQGFTRVHNVDGGINAYAERIDPTIPTY